MKVVGRTLLGEFAGRHSDAAPQLSAWLLEVEEARWESPKDVKLRYPHASVLAGNCMIFNIKGNRYRLEAKINYAAKVLAIIRVGTHAEYSKWKQ
jgi:mRNA interferase HigB